MTIKCSVCGHVYPKATGERLAKLVAKHEATHR